MLQSHKKGFTLIEMLVVIAIIAVLVSIIIPTVSGATTKAKAAVDAATLRTVMAEASIDWLYGVGPGVKDSTGYVTIHNQGGLISLYATPHNDLQCKSIPGANLYVDGTDGKIMVAFQDHPTYGGDIYYTLEDFARAAETGELKATGKKADNPILPDFP